MRWTWFLLRKKLLMYKWDLSSWKRIPEGGCSGWSSGNVPVLSFQVKMALQQEGFNRKKRGYRDINEIDINMNDPLFTKQWYLVSISVLFLMFLILGLQIEDAFLFPHYSVGCQPASNPVNLSVSSDMYWFSVTTHASHSLICFLPELLNSPGSKQLPRAGQIPLDSEKALLCVSEDLQKHVKAKSKFWEE